MTYKQPDGLDPRRYKNRTSAPVSRSFVRRSAADQFGQRERKAVLAQVRTARRATGGQAGAPKRAGSHLDSGKQDASERGPKRLERVVTMPHEAVQPLTWAERHARYRARPSGSGGLGGSGRAGGQAAKGRLVPRTLAQTGRPAQNGQMRARKPLPPMRGGVRTPARVPSRVPSRSGKLRRRRSGWRRLWGLLFILALIAGGIAFALFGPTFRVEQIDINGTHNQKLISSIRSMGIKGQDIFLLNRDELVTRLEAMPPVASASLGIALPGTVQVDVQERTPVLLWQAGKTTFALAQDGTIIAPQGDLSGTEHLPLVVDNRRSAGQIHPGSHFNTADIILAEQVFEQAPGIEGVAPFSLHYVDTINEGGHQVPANLAGSGSFVIVSANGWQAYLGDSQNSATLATRLFELQQILQLARQKNMQIATIDLRFGQRPAYTLKP